jgi:hypothetical protein
MLNIQYSHYISKLKNIDPTDTHSLKSYIEEGLAESPGAVLWSLLSDPRDDLQSQGNYFLCKIIYQLFNSVSAGYKEPVNSAAGSDVMTDHMKSLQNEYAGLKKEQKSLFRKLDKAQKNIEQLQCECELKANRIAELESRPSREGKLLREIRMLQYKLESTENTCYRNTVISKNIDYEQSNKAQNDSVIPQMENPDCDEVDTCPLDALKVAVIGGLERLEPRYQSIVEQLGGEFVFHNGVCKSGVHVLRNIVCNSDIIVFITSVNSHNAMWIVRMECKKFGKKFTVLKQTGPDALKRKLLAEINDKEVNNQ